MPSRTGNVSRSSSSAHDNNKISIIKITIRKNNNSLCTGRGGFMSGLGLRSLTRLGLTSWFGLMYGGRLLAGVSGGVGLPGIGLCW
jgi:hypothetical protein